MLNFLKGIVIGLGAVSPGLSGSILLVIFGLYAKTVDAISSIFKTFKKSREKRNVQWKNNFTLEKLFKRNECP